MARREFSSEMQVNPVIIYTTYCKIVNICYAMIVCTNPSRHSLPSLGEANHDTVLQILLFILRAPTALCLNISYDQLSTLYDSMYIQFLLCDYKLLRIEYLSVAKLTNS